MNLTVKFSLLLITLVVIAREDVLAQDLVYDVQDPNGCSVGTCTVKMSEKNEQIKIEIRTDVKIKLIDSLKLAFNSISKFKNGFLLSSESYSYVNMGHLHSSTNTYWKKDDQEYNITSNHGKRYATDSIHYSSSQLFFKEPVEGISVYSEVNGSNSLVNHKLSNVYEIRSKESEVVSEYYYSENQLLKFIIYHPLQTLIFILKK